MTKSNSQKKAEGYFDRAKKLAYANDREYSPEVEKLLRKAMELGHGEATYAIATWHLHGHGEVRKDLALAHKLLRKAAEAGTSAAWYDLAVSYENGDYFDQSFQTAFLSYLMAGLLGDKQAIYEAGSLMYNDKDQISLDELKDNFANSLLKIAEVMGVSENTD